MQKALTLFDTTLGKKAVMAVTGLVLFGFVIGHMLGNLQVYLGPEQLNGYAEGLRKLGALLWVVRGVLFISLVLHMAMVISLYDRSLKARSQRYKMRRNLATNYAAITMWLSGPLIFFFVLYHLAHFTFPGVAMGNYQHLGHGQVYTNVMNGFGIPWVVAVYVAAQIFLGMHLYHGSWSFLQSLGASHPRYNERRKQVARTIAMLVVVGNISIPLSVLFGIIR